MVHAITIFISAFLLFQVQLIMSKRILPWFGGSPAVWTTCMLFFQTLLLGGYAYAYGITTRTSRKVQAWGHGGLILISLLLLGGQFILWQFPLLPPDSWKPEAGANPVMQILILLGCSLGLPFFILSTTGPLLQRWYSLETQGEGHYRLYALSNLGSILGLLSYPFLVEPMMSLPVQAWVWAVLYFLFALGVSRVAFRLRPSKVNPEFKGNSKADSTSLNSLEPISEEALQPRPAAMTIVIWMLLACVTSSMFLSVTNNLCQEVAVVPFLWVLPLVLYLLSFILCFDNPRWYRRRWFVLATSVASLAVLVTAFQGITLGIPSHVISYSLFLFLFCMTCHGELVRLRPGARYLTLFYLAVSVGGAMGGVFVALIAPLVFKSFWEFHVTMLAGWAVLALVFYRDKRSFFFRGDPWHFILTTVLLTYLGIRLSVVLGLWRGGEWVTGNLTLVALIGAISFAGILWAFLRKRRLISSKYWPRILVGAVIFMAECFMLNRIRSTNLQASAVDRNFFGVVRVYRKIIQGDPPLLFTQLTHGQITHGIQFKDEPLRHQPVSYYSTNSGVALAIRHHARRSSLRPGADPLRVGVLGLGAGTVAGYAHRGDWVKFYEINPVVVRHSLGPSAFFTYLRECPAEIEVVPGDARLSMQRELKEGNTGNFDLLVMDAFSSDSIPVHLLTLEAFSLYEQHLRNEAGIIAVNISNRFLDLRDLMFSLAERMDYEIVLIEHRGDPPDYTPSLWVLMTRDQRLAELPEIRSRATDYKPTKTVIWTDQYSNLLELLN
jgi:hypothetical protein